MTQADLSSLTRRGLLGAGAALAATTVLPASAASAIKVSASISAPFSARLVT